MFSCKFWKFLRTPFLTEHLRWLLLRGVLKNFAKITGKRLCWSLFFNKVAGLRPTMLLKERLQHRLFPVNFTKFLRKPFFTEHLRCQLQKQSFRGVFRERCSENMQQIYRRTSMPKCDFNKLQSNFMEIALRYGCSSVNLLHIF